MKYLPLMWKSLWRRKVHTTFTLLSIFVAFLLFGGADDDPGGVLARRRSRRPRPADPDSQDQPRGPAPGVGARARLQGVEGVDIATHSSSFSGIYQDPKHFIAQMAVEPEQFMTIYKEFRLPPEQMKAWLNDRQGAIAGA